MNRIALPFAALMLTYLAAPSAGAQTVDFYVGAHEDDWQFFMGDAAASSVKAGGKVVFIYTSAGDGGFGQEYANIREIASKASVDTIAGRGPWACAPKNVNTHPILRCTKARTVSYYMRVPDGNSGDGAGFGGRGSLSILRGNKGPVATLDQSTRYTSWRAFTSTLAAIVKDEAAGHTPHIHTSDYDHSTNPGDHPDHLSTGAAVRTAAAQHHWKLTWYVGYNLNKLPPNLNAASRAMKQIEIAAYDRITTRTGVGPAGNNQWLQRTYSRGDKTPPATSRTPIAAARDVMQPTPQPAPPGTPPAGVPRPSAAPPKRTVTPPGPPPAPGIPVAAERFSTTFAGLASGVLPKEWTVAYGQQSSNWSVQSSSSAAHRSVLQGEATSEANHILGSRVIPATSTSAELLVKMRMTKDNDRGPGIVLRYTSGGPAVTAYVAYLRPAWDQLELDRFVNGEWKAIVSGTFVSNPGRSYWLRGRVNGAAIQVKAWPDGTPEPAAWTLVASDDAIRSGGVGLYMREANIVEYDSFSATAGVRR